MIALRKHCLFYGINRDVLFNERSGLQIGGALLYALELGTAFFVTFQFHVVAEDTDLVRFFEYYSGNSSYRNSPMIQRSLMCNNLNEFG